MTTNAIHPLGYGLPMRAAFALAMFYSAPDTTIQPAIDAPTLILCYFEPATARAIIEPNAGAAFHEPNANPPEPI